MINNSVDLINTLNAVAKHIPINTRNQIKGRFYGLIARMTNNRNNYADSLNEWIEIITRTINEAQLKDVLYKEIGDLDLFLKKLKRKQAELSRTKQHVQNPYQTRVVPGTITDRYF